MRENEIDLDLISKQNKKNLDLLLAQKYIVPFIGAGFSRPACPGWSEFLELFFQAIKEEFLQQRDEEHYLHLKNSNRKNKLEKMADFLVKNAGRRKFEEEIKDKFDKILLPCMERKFSLLLKAFPGLKITTNYDDLIENVPSYHVRVVYGNHVEDMEQSFTYLENKSLLKIHGGLRDISTIILSSSQYAALYGDPKGFDPGSPLPRFLERVFCNSSVLFIGCSLLHDRTLMIMESIKDMRPHFAVMHLPGSRTEFVEINRRLSNFKINLIWINDFVEIEEILSSLAELKTQIIETPRLKSCSPFVGRVKELEQLRGNLKNSISSESAQVIVIDGAGGIGKTALAIAAALEFSKSPLFEDFIISPILVNEYTPISFAMHLANQFQLKELEPENKSAAQALVTGILKNRHALLILDNAVDWKMLKYMMPTETCSTLLITTCNRDLYDRIRLGFPQFMVYRISLKKFSNDEALELFKEMLSDIYRETDKSIYLQIAKILGYLPIALRQAVSLIRFNPHYRTEVLLGKLEKECRLDLLREGWKVDENNYVPIESIYDLSSSLLTNEYVKTLEYLAVCAPGPVPLDFLRKLSRDKEIDEHLERLYTLSWCERREIKDERVYELHELVRELIKNRIPNRLNREFLGLVDNIFLDDPTVHYSIKEKFMPQLEEAFTLATARMDNRLTKWVGGLFLFCTYRGYTDFYLRLVQQVEELFPSDLQTKSAIYGYRALILKRKGKLKKAMKFHKKEEKLARSINYLWQLAHSYGNQAVILIEWGQLEEAMTLLKKEESICLQIPDRSGEARSYGNQALILKMSGKLTDAMALLKKEEKIKTQLGDRAGLAICYSNQGRIHSDWGEQEVAMARHRKEEKICSEFGDLAGLARSYGNQAVILRYQGKLQKAMALHEKEEKLALVLGNRFQLARSYGNHAMVLSDMRKYKKALALHKKEEKIKEELGDRAGLARSYGNQALIYMDIGKLDEAINLLKKEEKICEELPDLVRLAISWWNQGCVYNKKKDYIKQGELWQKSIDLNKSIGIPTNEDELELLKIRGLLQTN